MAYFVAEGRDMDSHRRGVKMQIQPQDGIETLLPKEGHHDHIRTRDAGIMEKSGPSFLQKTIGTRSDMPHKGKRVIDDAARKNNCNLFYPYGKDAPEVKRPFQVRDPSEDELKALMLHGAEDSRERQRKAIEDSPSRFDRQLKQGVLMNFYKEHNPKREHATEKAINLGYGTRKHGLLDDIVREDEGPHRGKKVKNSVQMGYDMSSEKIFGFRGLGSTPGNLDPYDPDHKPHKIARDYSYDPLNFKAKGAAPKHKAMDDFVPQPVVSPSRLNDGIQARALLGNSPTRMNSQYQTQQQQQQQQRGNSEEEDSRLVAELAKSAPSIIGKQDLPKRHPPPAVAKYQEDPPRSTKHYTQYQVGVGQGPDLIPGFQGLGSVNINTHEIVTELKETPHGLKKLRPQGQVTHYQYPGPTSTSKRVVHGEPGDGRGQIFGDGRIVPGTMSSTNSAYGTGGNGQPPVAGGKLQPARAQSSLLP